jgi:hypothetical protein
VRRQAKAKAISPEANAKKGACWRGKPKPAHLLEALRKANVGRKLTEEHKAKIGAALRRGGH